MSFRILLGITAVLAVVDAADQTWSLVFDAGSSGTRMQLFKITKEAGKTDVFEQFTPSDEEDEKKLAVEPGLSGHLLDGNVAFVRRDLANLLAEAARYVPKDLQASTPVRLGATAGLRLLTIEQQNDVIAAATNALADKSVNPFKPFGAFIMSGEEEALFGWLAVNYFLGKFNKYDPAGTVGALDLGGASTQIAYFSPGQILEGQQPATVNGKHYRIYGTSFLKFGANEFGVQVFKLIKSKSKTASTKDKPYDNPCQCVSIVEENDQGFFKGTGNWDACSSLVDEILNVDNQPCVFTDGIGRCSILSKYLAPMAKSFYGFSAYFFAANGIGLLGWNDAKKLSPNDFKRAGKTWCATTRSKFDNSYQNMYCRQSAYIFSLLSKGYGFKPDDSTSITFARKINGFSASWAMGLAMSYNPSSAMAKVTPAPTPTGPSKKWIRTETKAICDTSAGEVYIKGSPGKLMTAEQCQKSCEDYTGCKSITFFKSGWCSLFSTECTKTRRAGKVEASYVMVAQRLLRRE